MATKLSTIENMLKNASNSQYKAQEAQLRQTRDTSVADLEKAYQQSIYEGNKQIDDAGFQFENAQKQINKQHYLDTQRTGLASQQLGIQNSQQALGLQASDNARRNDLVSTATVERDRRINDLRDRISMITKQKDLDIANVNRGYNTGLQGARAQADAMFQERWSGVLHEDYTANRNYQFDLKKMDKQFNNDLAKMAKQHGYDMSKLNAQQRNAMAQIGAQKNAQMAQAQQQYELERKRVADAYKKGTPEYNIRMAQIQEAEQQALGKFHQEALYQSINEVMKPGSPGYNTWLTNPGAVMSNPTAYGVGQTPKATSSPSMSNVLWNAGKAAIGSLLK